MTHDVTITSVEIVERDDRRLFTHLEDNPFGSAIATPESVYLAGVRLTVEQAQDLSEALALCVSTTRRWGRTKP